MMSDALVRCEKQRCYRFFHISLLVWIVSSLQWALFLWGRYRFEHVNYNSFTQVWWSIGVSSFVTLWVFQVVNLASLNRKRVRAVANMVLVLLFAFLVMIHLLLEHPLDFYLIGDNFGSLFFAETLVLIGHHASLEIVLTAVNFTLTIVLLNITTTAFSFWPQPRRYRMNLAFHVALLIAVIMTPLYRHNDLTFLARTAIDYFAAKYTYPGLPTVDKYPYVHKLVTSDRKAIANSGPRPHIFLLLMESFNANYAETKNLDGQEYTPVFNSRIKEGVYVERFYGNSIQSARAIAPLLCSIPPSYRGKISVTHPGLRLRSIVHILRELGYRTQFYEAYDSLDFDKLGDFMLRLGFDAAYAMDDKFVGPDDHQWVWGWGIQDDKFYQKVLAHLDQQRQPAIESERTAHPFFTVLFTASHHYPFDEIPMTQRYLYPAPSNRKEHFANSIHLADRYLETFFQELESREYLHNSLVFICGDHSFPAGEHGNYYNEYRFYEENFRTPLLIWWPGKLVPQRIGSASAHSQLDIAPTILDLLNIKTNHHFQGHSILDPTPAEARPIPLIQPYDGTFLCIVKYPLKYVEGVRVPDKYLFRLDTDPLEQRSVLDEYAGTLLLETLKLEIQQIQLNQHLIERNRLWPRDDEL